MEQLQHQQSDVRTLRQQLREITTQRDRLRILSQDQVPDLTEVATILNVRERVIVADHLLQQLNNLKFKKEGENVVLGLMLPELIKFDRQLDISIVFGTDLDLARTQATYDVFKIIKDAQAYLPEQICMLSFALNVKQFLCAPSTESLSETEAAVSQIMRQLTDFILFQMQNFEAGITARSMSKFCAGIRLIFDVVFGELL